MTDGAQEGTERYRGPYKRTEDGLKPILDHNQAEDEYGHLSITLHTTVLGVDITGYPRKEAALMDGFETRGGLTPEPELETWDGTPHTGQHIRRELAAWARRNLFEGARPHE